MLPRSTVNPAGHTKYLNVTLSTSSHGRYLKRLLSGCAGAYRTNTR